jgi:hypothetical protein
MAAITGSFRNTIERLFARRRARQATGVRGSDDDRKSRSPQVFDTITLESIVSLRGQNPFPEEEGELRFMSSTMRERSLHSR